MANFNFNRFEFGGRVASDLELKADVYGTSVISFPLAVTRRNAKGEERSDFFRVTAFGKTAEHIAKYFAKGSSIFVCGYARVNSYTSKDGEKRYSTDFIAEDVRFVDSKSENPAFTAPAPDADPNSSAAFDDADLPF